jgi:hypothetical protein
MVNVNVKRTGGPVLVTVVVGHNQRGVHRMFLWQADITGPEALPTDALGNYVVGEAATLDQKVISWEVRIAASTPINTGTI